MPENTTSRDEYVRRILEAYRKIPGTTGQVHREDRRLARSLHEQGVPPHVVENAFVLAAARRLLRDPESPPLGTIRSLHYFVPVIDEVPKLPVSQDYFIHLRRRIQRYLNGPKGE